ncbi:ribonucleotide-diphosphate reductase subunit alpha, partial [Psychrobacter sp. 1Y1]
FEDQEEFERLYLKYEADSSIRKKQIKAVELFSLMMQERASTGRIYIQNVDHCNTHSPFDSKVAPVRQSNLCLEIALPTKPLNNINDPDGEIALCTLSALNLGAIKKLEELEPLADLAVRALDNLLDYQDYPIISAEKASMNRRTLGIGVINFANYLAKEGVRYSDGSANGITHKTFEAIQFYLLKA